MQIPRYIGNISSFSVGLNFLLMGLISTIMYLEFRRPPVKYWLIDGKASSHAVGVLREPNFPNELLIRWSTLAVVNILSADFANPDLVKVRSKPFFTDAGYDAFLSSLDTTERLNDIVSKKLIAQCIAIKPAVVLSEYLKFGSKYWRIQVPILIRYQGASASDSDTPSYFIADMDIEANEKNSFTGFGIAKLKLIKS